MVSPKGQQSGSLLPHDYRIEHRRQDEHTESGDNAGTHKDATNRGETDLGRGHSTRSSWAPEPSYPSRLSYQQGVHRASRLPSTMPGLGLTPAKTTNTPLIKPDKRSLLTRASCLPARKLGLGLTRANKLNTSVQIAFLQVRKPLLPGECYSSQLKGSRTSPRMLCPESESPKLRE